MYGGEIIQQAQEPVHKRVLAGNLLPAELLSVSQEGLCPHWNFNSKSKRPIIMLFPVY